MSRLKRLVSFRVSPIFGRMVPFKVGLALVWAWGASNALASPPPMTPRDVDFTGNHPMRNVEGMFPDPEVTWTSGGSYSAPAISIDIMGDLSVKFQHFNNSEKLGNATFQLNFAELEMPNGTTTQLLVNGQSSASGPVSIPAYGTFWSPTFQISGWDNWIHAGTLRVGYQINTSSIPGLLGFGMTREWRFIVNLEPPIGHMNPVWHELLEESTLYAWGELSADPVAYDLTFGLYYAERFAYVGWPYYAKWIENNTFLLEELLSTPGWISGNCHDVANYLMFLFQTQGLQGQSMVRFLEGGGHFVTNEICPIGSDSDNPSTYITVLWGNHGVVFWNDLNFDACLALKLAPDLSNYFNPPASWSHSDHWYKSHGAQFTGVAKRYATTAESLFNYIDPSIHPMYHVPSSVDDVPFPLQGVL